MTKTILTRTLAGLAVIVSGPALAQGWAPGAEIIGQPIRVTTNGVTNTLLLAPGGQAQITSPGGRVVNGTWSAANGQLCLSNGMAQECVPYAQPLQAGQAMTVTSSCGASETWLAEATNAPPPPPPAQGQRGERGR